MEKKRPGGITAFSILYILMGLIFLIACPLLSVRFGLIFLIIGWLFFSFPYLIVGIGIFLLRPFSRYLAIFLSLLGIVSSIARTIYFSLKSIRLEILFACIMICFIHFFIIYYFTRPKVKEQFK